MVISSTLCKHVLSGDGANLVFQYLFLVPEASQLIVIHTSAAGVDTTLVLDTDYTFVGAGVPAGGTITIIGSAPTATETITLIRIMPLKQETDYEMQGGFFPDTLEDSIDQLTMIAQQHKEELDRCAKVGQTSTTPPGDVLDAIDAVSGLAAAAAQSAADAAAYAETAKAPCVPHIIWNSNSSVTIKEGTEADADDGTMRMSVAADIAVDIAGNGANGLDIGAEANGIYQIWLIYNPTTSTTAGLLVLSEIDQQAPVMPAGYTKKRCIGFVENAAGDFVGFHQAGDLYLNVGDWGIAVADPGLTPGTAYDLKTKCSWQITAAALVRFRLKPDPVGDGQLNLTLPGGNPVIAEMMAGADLISLAPFEIPMQIVGGDFGFTLLRVGSVWSTFSALAAGYRLKFPALIKTGTP